eukprot:TRINITY_DN16398_c0_g1_i1.p1 TRINITY_DN16398_c0_g1~~TRINITY_DN16398_c0_g1_i1.p1  ORF type:complete len:283 (+),score=34.55 TRINITY_DN16398_c0_g1_i1:75-923(+)
MDLAATFLAGCACSGFVNAVSEPFERMYSKRMLDIISPGRPTNFGEFLVKRVKDEGVMQIVTPSVSHAIRRSRVARDSLVFGVRELTHAGFPRYYVASEWRSFVTANFAAGAASGLAAALVSTAQKPVPTSPPSVVCKRVLPMYVAYYGMLFGVADSTVAMLEYRKRRNFARARESGAFAWEVIVSSMLASVAATFAAQPFRVAAEHQLHRNHYTPMGRMKYYSLPHTIRVLTQDNGNQILFRGMHLDRVLYTTMLLVLVDATKKFISKQLPVFDDDLAALY